MIYATLIGLMAVIFWSMNVIIASLLAGHLAPIVITFCRWSVAGIVLLPFVLKHFHQIKLLSSKDWLLVVIQGIVSVILFNTFVYVAGETAKAIDMALIGTTGPIFMAIFSFFIWKTHITLHQALGYLCAILGVFIILLHGNLENLFNFHFVIGDVWMLLSAICFALYSSLVAFKSKQISSALFLELSIIVGCIIMSPFAIYHLLESNFSGFTKSNIIAICYMGIFQSIVAFMAWNYCLLKLGNVRAGLIFYTMPIFSSIAAYYVLGESVQLSQSFGGLLVLTGIVYAALENKADVKAVARP